MNSSCFYFLKIGILPLLLLCSFFEAAAQVEDIDDYIPKTPEVSYFERYGGTEVDEYSGIHTAMISLHHLESKGVEFPINLQYSSGGIQVTQEATWVGLGWNLQLLGSISTVPVGGVDDPNFNAPQNDLNDVINYSPNGTPWPRIFNNVGIAEMTNPSCGGFPYHPPVNIPSSAIVNENRKGNTERDIYKVNLLGQSFELFIKPITNEILFNGEKMPYQITFQNNSWQIIDDKGYKYFFSTSDGYRMQGSPNQRVSTWHLTKVYYQSQLLVNIVYDNWNIVPLPTFSETRYIHNGNDYDHPTFGHNNIVRTVNFVNEMSAKYPKYITAGLDSIVFEKSSRVDMVGAPALTAISIFSRADKSLVKKSLLKAVTLMELTLVPRVPPTTKSLSV